MYLDRYICPGYYHMCVIFILWYFLLISLSSIMDTIIGIYAWQRTKSSYIQLKSSMPWIIIQLQCSIPFILNTMNRTSQRSVWEKLGPWECFRDTHDDSHLHNKHKQMLDTLCRKNSEKGDLLHSPVDISNTSFLHWHSYT